MYKIVIVDDEYSAAKAMAKFINYEEFNFTVAEVFKSAGQVIEYIENNNVDLIISDIKMQGMSGIDLLKIVNEKYPRIKVILVSAYRDFSYAKEAISNNAFEYITKPVSYSEFTAAIQKVADFFAKREDTALANINDAELLYTSITDYFNGVSDVLALEKCLKMHTPDIDVTNCNCSLININIPDITRFFAEKWKYGSEKFIHAIRQIIPMCMNEVIFSFFSSENSNIRIISIELNKSGDYKKRVDGFISHMNYEIFSIFGLNVEISIINTANSLIELKETGTKTTSQVFKKIMYCINRKNEEEINDILTDFFEMNISENQRELCKLLSDETVKYGVEDYNLILDEIGIKCLGKPQLLKDYCISIIKLFDKELKFAEPKSMLLLKAICYISRNFAEEISLNSISKHIGLTPSYLSHYFKKEMQESYSDFIIKIRMENAKKILTDAPETKISNLVSLVGYKSQPYFYKAFQEYVGCLPGEFKGME